MKGFEVRREGVRPRPPPPFPPALISNIRPCSDGGSGRGDLPHPGRLFSSSQKDLPLELVWSRVC